MENLSKLTANGKRIRAGQMRLQGKLALYNGFFFQSKDLQQQAQALEAEADKMDAQLTIADIQKRGEVASKLIFG